MLRKLVGILLGVLFFSTLTAQEFSVFYIASPNGTLSWCRCPEDPYGGLPRRASAIKQAQSTESSLLILDAGDLLAPFPSRLKDSVFVETYSRIPVDAVAFGDQELIDGYPFFSQMVQPRLPLISANAYRNSKRLLPAYKIIQRDGVRIAVISLITPEAFIFYDQETLDGVVARDPSSELKALMPELKSKAEVIILLSHLGFNRERKIAKEFPDIDIIVSGHTPEILKQSERIGETYILGAGEDAKHFGLARFRLEADSLILAGNRITALSDRFAEDASIQRVVAPYIEAEDVEIDSSLTEQDTVTSEHKPVLIHAFYAPDCPHCMRMLKVFLPRLASKYPGLFKVRVHNIDNPEEYNLLVEWEKDHGVEEQDIPALFFEGKVLDEDADIKGNLEKMLLDLRPSYSASDSATHAGELLVVSVDTVAEVSDTLIGEGDVEVVFFESFGCEECDRVRYWLKALAAEDTSLSIRVYDTSDPEAKSLLSAFGIVYGIPADEVLITPIVFVGRGHLSHDELSAEEIGILVEGHRDEDIPWEEVEKAKATGHDRIVREFERFSLLPIIGAGLIDGINPCAFATLIFFITYLSVLGVERKRTIWIALPFIISVFCTYLILGFIAYQILAILGIIQIVSQVIFGLTVVLLLFLAGMTFYDFLLLKRGKGEKMKLKLPDRIKKRMNKIIRKRTAFGGFILGGIITGFLVSIFELVCTGQVYLPTLVYMVQTTEKWSKALIYLVVYNVAFILPLIVVFVLVRFGLTERHLQRFLTRNAALTKVLTGILFLVLAGVMSYLLIRGFL
ncbi:hypothetical protein GF359_02395 [candidate division WOR-3 bacterium]|uniref:Thioredoxin domain-containing protein n=1 Tax=candidate division WOR-3 bacterium TaxID=2052148 RepID=A0A9D5K8I1_UNCW3|nr:hypothetical protein [candidate division WOR-3 bacterium]MBD3364044.1 hypothetical protein [candidate division WOR-3 bacterium]